MVMLPDNMFINLINTDLQERIAVSDDLDGNAAEVLKLLLELQQDIVKTFHNHEMVGHPGEIGT